MRFINLLAAGTALAIAACGDAPYDPRGVDHGETLLSVSATGQAETRPDEAFFQAGLNSYAGTARAASDANTRDIAKVVDALKAAGIAEQDIQTRAVSVGKVDWGPNKGQFQAANVVAVTVRNVNAAGRAVTAATEAGANLVSGPDLRRSDPEKAATEAYGAAYRAAKLRAEAYAEAAGMGIARVLTIRDGGAGQVLVALRAASAATGRDAGEPGERGGADHAGADDKHGCGSGGLRARAEIIAQGP